MSSHDWEHQTLMSGYVYYICHWARKNSVWILATIPTLNSNNIKPGMLTAVIVKLRLFIRPFNGLLTGSQYWIWAVFYWPGGTDPTSWVITADWGHVMCNIKCWYFKMMLLLLILTYLRDSAVCTKVDEQVI